MAKNRFFGKDIEHRCEYCERGRKSSSSTAILCERKGIVDAGYSCKKFEYDPLKRVPKRMNKLPEFDPSDFSL